MIFPRDFDELAILQYAEDQFPAHHPNLPAALFGAGGVTALILRWPVRKEPLAAERARAVLDELLRLLDREDFRRSRSVSRALSALVLATVVGRPQFGDTGGLKRLWGSANASKEMGNLKRCVDGAYFMPGAKVRIRFAENRSRGDRPYTPQFDFAGEDGRFPPLPVGPPVKTFSRSFTAEECAFYLATYLSRVAGCISIFTRDGEALASAWPLQAVLSNPAAPGKLSVVMLDPRCAEQDGAEGLAKLRRWEETAHCGALRIGFHADPKFRMTIVSLPDGRLFAQEDGKFYTELSPGDTPYDLVKASMPQEEGVVAA